MAVTTCICYDDGVMPVLNMACPEHGNSDAAAKLKAALEDVNRHTILDNFKGPGTAEEEDGVVVIKDVNGHVRLVMALEDYLAIRKTGPK